MGLTLLSSSKGFKGRMMGLPQSRLQQHASTFTAVGLFCNHFRTWLALAAFASDEATVPPFRVPLDSLEDSDGYTRHNFNAIITDRDLHETYLPPFAMCVAVKPEEIMCSCE
jgi:hypothetical protein